MQPPQRYIPSVSDLYGTDEIEFLLDEIRDLEPACCQLEDIQVRITTYLLSSAGIYPKNGTSENKDCIWNNIVLQSEHENQDSGKEKVYLG